MSFIKAILLAPVTGRVLTDKQSWRLYKRAMAQRNRRRQIFRKFHTN